MFVEIQRGHSFKGLAKYCLHDAQAKSSERVTVLGTRNLATDDPHIGWNTMAAHHALQNELKEKSGVGPGGPQGKPVGHLVIGWGKEEADAQKLDDVEMLASANGAIRAIGASKHQAIIVAHNDTENPHLHVILNLIREDGRLKSNHYEHKKLSKFALEREIKIHGEPVVKLRERNWRARDAGESPTPVKKKPRHLYELDKAAQKSDQVKEFAVEHRKKLAALQKEKEILVERQRRHQTKLLWCYKERNRRVEAAIEEKTRRSKSEIRNDYSPLWDDLLRKQEADRAAFEKNESNLKGSLANAMKMIDWKRLFRSRNDPDQETVKLSDAFQILTSEATRREKLKKQQQQEKERLQAKQHAEENAREVLFRKEQSDTIRENRQRYANKLDTMKDRQERNRQLFKQAQQKLTQERNDVLQQYPQQEQILEKERLLREKVAQQKIDPVEQANDNNENYETPSRRIRRPRKERKPREPRLSLEERNQNVNSAEKQKLEFVPKVPVPEHGKKKEPSGKEKDDFEERMMKYFNERSQSRDIEPER